MQIHGLNKTTLLDYPEHVACTVFCGSCNLRCPFCQNADLVLNPTSQPSVSEEDFFEFLRKRRNMLEGVCITGGEPTLQKDLTAFIRKIKDLGLLVKLDTNGYRPDVLSSLLEQHLVDYVAMDLKSSKAGYAKACGMKDFDLSAIERSVSLLMQGSIPYEFRTTVVRELHTADDFADIASRIKGCRAYFLQSYTESDAVLHYALPEEERSIGVSRLSAYTPEELRTFVDFLNREGVPAKLRGVS